jgi:hypothetical protein
MTVGNCHHATEMNHASRSDLMAHSHEAEQPPPLLSPPLIWSDEDKILGQQFELKNLRAEGAMLAALDHMEGGRNSSV